MNSRKRRQFLFRHDLHFSFNVDLAVTEKGLDQEPSNKDFQKGLDDCRYLRTLREGGGTISAFGVRIY
jgi:hypothetical protein